MEHTRPGFKLIGKCVNDMQEYVDQSNCDHGFVGVVTAFKKNGNIKQDRSNAQKQDHTDEQVANVRTLIIY